MLTHNVILTEDFERQSRARIQQAADNARKLHRMALKETPEQVIPARKPVVIMDWLKHLRAKPAD
jgi:hypothetical protein